MAKRKKRLEKGIESLEKQIEIHEVKEEKAIEQDGTELAEYYEKEIEKLKEVKEKKKKQLSKL